MHGLSEYAFCLFSWNTGHFYLGSDASLRRILWLSSESAQCHSVASTLQTLFNIRRQTLLQRELGMYDANNDRTNRPQNRTTSAESIIKKEKDEYWI